MFKFIVFIIIAFNIMFSNKVGIIHSKIDKVTTKTSECIQLLFLKVLL